MHLIHIIGYIAGALIILFGLFANLIPSLPGLIFMLIGMFLVAYIENFKHLGGITFIILIAITIFGSMLDFIAGICGARKSKASKLALYGAFLGGIVGLFFGIIGAVLGPIIGAIFGELLNKPNIKQASKVGIGTFIGFLLGTCAKITCAFTMLAVFGLAFAF